MSDDQENEEEYNQQNQQEQQRITSLLQKQMFQGTPETPSPQGFNVNSQ